MAAVVRAAGEGIGLIAVLEDQQHIFLKLSSTLVLPPIHFHFDRPKVHGLLDNVVVVVETKGESINRFIERPSVPRVLLPEHLTQHLHAELERFAQTMFWFEPILTLNG